MLLSRKRHNSMSNNSILSFFHIFLCTKTRDFVVYQSFLLSETTDEFKLSENFIQFYTTIFYTIHLHICLFLIRIECKEISSIIFRQWCGIKQLKEFLVFWNSIFHQLFMLLLQHYYSKSTKGNNWVEIVCYWLNETLILEYWMHSLGKCRFYLATWENAPKHHYSFITQTYRNHGMP